MVSRFEELGLHTLRAVQHDLNLAAMERRSGAPYSTRRLACNQRIGTRHRGISQNTQYSFLVTPSNVHLHWSHTTVNNMSRYGLKTRS